jgi:uncharacterized membrane protein
MASASFKDFLEGTKYPNDLVLVIISAIVSAAGVFFSEDGDHIRAILGIPLLVFLPGYAFVAVLWPARHGGASVPTTGKLKILKGGLTIVERLVFSVSLSIVLVTIIGLILNYISSITLLPILIALTAFTAACAAIAWHLRMSLPQGERFTVSMSTDLKSAASNGTGAEKALSVILAASIIVSMGAIVWLLVNPAEAGPYTEFYLLDEDRMLEDLPKNLTVNETGTVLVSIVNHEHKGMDYTLTAHVGNSSTGMEYTTAPSIMITGAHSLATNVSLEDASTFEQEYTIRFAAPGRYRLVWQLEVGGQSTDYELHMWVNVA